MSKKQLVVFMGPPGAGKGSLSKLCVKKFAWQQLSTGDLCRKHIKEQTDIGREIDFCIKSGKLVSDTLIVEMVRQWLKEVLPACTGVILDGFPRTIDQARFLKEFIHIDSGQYGLKIFKLRVSDQEVITRLQDRYICCNKNCQTVYSCRDGSSLAPRFKGTCDRCQGKLVQRKDDTCSSIDHRLKTYHAFEQGLIGFYDACGYEVTSVNGEKPIDAVFKDIEQMIGVNT